MAAERGRADRERRGMAAEERLQRTAALIEVRWRAWCDTKAAGLAEAEAKVELKVEPLAEVEVEVEAKVVAEVVVKVESEVEAEVEVLQGQRPKKSAWRPLQQAVDCQHSQRGARCGRAVPRRLASRRAST